MLADLTIVPPYGGKLVNLVVGAEERDELKARAFKLPSLQLNDRCACDLELLATGGFSPLDRFMGQADFERVVREMRLADGTLWPMPITLPVDAEHAADIKPGLELALRDSHNNLLAVMSVEEVYPWDVDATCQGVLGTLDTRHPLVAEMQRWGTFNVSGPMKVLTTPQHYDFVDLRLTPAQVRERLAAQGRPNVVAFQTRNPMHRAHEELTRRAADSIDGMLLLHPSVGMTRPGDVDHYTRVRCYKALGQHHYDPSRFLLSLLPLAMRMAGPREAVWHAIIRRNFGANHFIVGRDHAGPGNDSTGKPFYGPYDAQELAKKHADEIGVTIMPFHQLVYLPDSDTYEQVELVPEGTKTWNISGTQVREDYLNLGKPLPEWFTRPEVARILAEEYPPRHRQGFCLWFTGLSGAGKSTTVGILTQLMLQHGRHPITLDGDVVRTFLSSGLTFSREDRDANVRRIGFVASEVVTVGGAVMCAAISPYRSTRDEVRAMMRDGHFIEIYVDTPVNVCADRDVKGLYAKAQRGEIHGFTGVDDPYEPPENPELTLNTVEHTPDENARIILRYLQERGFVEAE